MKQKDIALILIIVVVSGTFSFILSGFLFNSEDARNDSVEVVKPITSEFIEPDPNYFNEKSRNPTATIIIGKDSNKDPFSGSE